MRLAIIERGGLGDAWYDYKAVWVNEGPAVYASTFTLRIDGAAHFAAQRRADNKWWLGNFHTMRGSIGPYDTAEQALLQLKLLGS